MTDKDLPEKDYETIDFYGEKLSVKYHYNTSVYPDVDNIKYDYDIFIVLNDFETLKEVHEKLKETGLTGEISYWCEYYVSGSKDDKVYISIVLKKKTN